MPRPRLTRIVQVTVGLSAVGVVIGSLIGGLLLALTALRTRGFGDLGPLVGYGVGFGALMGAVLAPVAAWTLMRHVPIWRAIADTAAGTIIGAGIGLIFQPMWDTAWLSPVWLGIAGFAVAGLRLRLMNRGGARASNHAGIG